MINDLQKALGVPLLVVELTTLGIAAMVQEQTVFMDDFAKMEGKKSVIEANIALKRTKAHMKVRLIIKINETYYLRCFSFFYLYYKKG